MRMKITFLGTSSGAPSRHRNISSIALQLPQKATLWLFDCGEGTQHQALRSTLRISQLERIFITHLHGDHIFGLLGLLASRSLQVGGVSPVTIYGPQGLSEYVRQSLHWSQMRPGYPIEVRTITPGIVFEDEDFTVRCTPVQHRIPAFAYSVTERDQQGRFDADKAQKMGIEPGPIYGTLKNGGTATLADGRVVSGADLTGPTRAGRKFVFSGDTTYCPNMVEIAQNADLLVHESTYLEEDRALAERASHSTAMMAATVAKEAGAKRLILTHFSARYDADGGNRMADLLAEAQAVFPSAQLAHDFLTYEIPRSENERSNE